MPKFQKGNPFPQKDELPPSGGKTYLPQVPVAEKPKPSIPPVYNIPGRQGGSALPPFDWNRVSTPYKIKQGQWSNYIGYEPSFWDNPQRVARYYHALRTLPPGREPPPWLDVDGINIAYNYLRARNSNTPWYEWKFLPANDPGREFLGGLPTPPADMLWPGEEKYANQGSPYTQPTTEPPQDLEFGGLTEEQWKELPAYQKGLIWLMGSGSRSGAAIGGATGLVGGALTGLAAGGLMGMGVGAIPGAFVGGLLGAGLGGMAQRSPKFADWMMLLDYPAEWFERTLGVLGLGYGLGISTLADKGFAASSDAVADVLNNLPSAWKAGHVFYESLPVFKTIDLGVKVPREVDTWALYIDAYDRIKSGESVEEVYRDLVGGEGQRGELGDTAYFRDLLGHMILDPLNAVGAITQLGILAKGAASGDDILKIAALTTKGPVEAMQEYGLLLRTTKTAEEISHMSAFTRWLAGVTKTGGVKALKPVGEISRLSRLGGAATMGPALGFLGYGIGGPVGGMIGTALGSGLGYKQGFSYLVNLTPAARATEVVSNAGVNLRLILNEAGDNPELMVKYIRSLGTTPQELARDLSMASINAPDGAALPLMFRDFAGKADDLLTAYKAADLQREMLKAISEVTGKEDWQVLRELENIGDADLLLKQYEEAARAANNTDILKAIEDGELTSKTLNEMVKVFTEDQIPYNTEQFLGQLYGAAMVHADNWAATFFNVKPDPTWMRLSQTVKSAQSLALLGLNPNYFVNNTLNNMVTMAASGVFGLRSQDAIDGIWKRVGVIPERLRAGLGAAAEGEKLPLEAIRKAATQRGMLHDLDQFFSKTTDKVGVFMKLSQRVEQWSSAQAYTSGFLQAWRRLWQPGVGYNRMPPLLEHALKQLDPNLPDLVYDAISQGLNKAEIEEHLWSGIARRSVDSFIPELARESGMTPADVRDLLSSTGAYDFLRERLTGDVNDDAIRKAFTDLQDVIERSLNEQHRQNLVEKAGKVAERVKGEGLQAALELFDDIELTINTEWIQTSLDWERVFGNTLDMTPGQRQAVIRKQFRLEEQKWRRIDEHEQATYLGIANALGIDNDKSRSFLDVLAQVHENKRDFHKVRGEKLEEFFNTIFTSKERRAAVWNAVQDELDQLYADYARKEIQLSQQMDEIFAGMMRGKYGEEAGDAARSWRKGIRDIREKMVMDMRAHRAGVRDLTPDERHAAWQQFYRDNWRPTIVDRFKQNTEGARRMVDIANGKLPPQEPQPPAPPSPPTEPSPVPIAPAPTAPAAPGATVTEGTTVQVPVMITQKMRQSLETLGYAPDEVAEFTPEQAWDLINGQVKAPAQNEKEATVRQIAGEFGIATADENGNKLPGVDTHIANIIAKYSGNDDYANLKPGELWKVKPEDARKAFEVRKAAKQAEAEKLPTLLSPEEEAAWKAQVETNKAELEARKAAGEDVEELNFKATGNPIVDSDRGSLPEEVSKAVEAEANMMLGELRSGEGPSVYVPKQTDVYADYVPSKTSNISWYRELNAKYKLDKGRVQAALTRIIEDAGKDKPGLKDVARVKEVITERLLGGDDINGTPPHPGVLLFFGREDDAAKALNDWLVSDWGLDATEEDLAKLTGGKFDELFDRMAKILAEDDAFLDEPTPDEIASEMAATQETITQATEPPTPADLNAFIEKATREMIRERERLQRAVDNWQATVDHPLYLLPAGETRQLLRDTAMRVGNVPEEQVDAWLKIVDARAETWAKQNNSTPEEWYRSRIAGMVEGAPGEGTLYQLPIEEQIAMRVRDAEAAIETLPPEKRDLVYAALDGRMRGGDLWLRDKETWGYYYELKEARNAWDHITGKRVVRGVYYQEASEPRTSRFELKIARQDYAAKPSRPEWIKAAIKEFGLTDDLNEAGYILPDGRMLDFSGKREGGPPGHRYLDHREIGRIVESESDSYSAPMREFASQTGSIRFYTSNGVMYVDLIGTVPTREQISVLKNAIRYGGDIYWDITSVDGMVLATDEIVDATREDVSKIVEYTRRIFEGDETYEDLSNILYQAPERWYYSALTRFVEGLKQDTMTVEQLRGMLGKAGVKADELKWTGFDDYLEGKTGKITKQEMLDYLRANEVQVTEVLKGETNLEWHQERFENYLRITTPDIPNAKIISLVNGRYQVWIDNEFQTEVGYLDQAKRFVEANAGKFSTTYDKYALPSGLNYRELLLTLPTEKIKMPFEEWIRERGPGTLEPDNPWNNEAFWRRAYEQQIEGDFYKSPHWEEPNILVHVRFDDRIDVDGKKTLLIEEIQSDWHQKGREKGYKTPEQTARNNEIESEIDTWRRKQRDLQSAMYDMRQAGRDQSETYLTFERRLRQIDTQINELAREQRRIREAIPPAPFSKNWHELAMKRMIRWAAENGYDRIAWTTGGQQADRYNLAKTIRELDWEKTTTGHYNLTGIDKQDNIVFSHRAVAEEELPGIVGVEIAKRITEADKGSLTTPEELVVGGEGMRGFYDRMLPSAVDKYVKKWGTSVQETRVSGEKPINRAFSAVSQDFDTKAEAQAYLDNILANENFAREEGMLEGFGSYQEFLREFPLEVAQYNRPGDVSDGKWYVVNYRGGDVVHSIDVTPEMKLSALEGQPLFQRAKGAAQFLDDGRALIRLMEQPDVSTLVHESAHIFRRDLEGADLDIAAKWAGAEDTPFGWHWSREAEEKFARGFERYLADGIAPTTELESVFKKFKQWLLAIYRAIVGSPIDVSVSPEIKGVFDRLLHYEVQEKSPYDFGISGSGQLDMFGRGEDLPIFSGTAMRGRESTFQPGQAGQQPIMPGLGEAYATPLRGAVEGGEAVGPIFETPKPTEPTIGKLPQADGVTNMLLKIMPGSPKQKYVMALDDAIRGGIDPNTVPIPEGINPARQKSIIEDIAKYYRSATPEGMNVEAGQIRIARDGTRFKVLNIDEQSGTVQVIDETGRKVRYSLDQLKLWALGEGGEFTRPEMRPGPEIIDYTYRSKEDLPIFEGELSSKEIIENERAIAGQPEGIEPGAIGELAGGREARPEQAGIPADVGRVVRAAPEEDKAIAPAPYLRNIKRPPLTKELTNPKALDALDENIGQKTDVRRILSAWDRGTRGYVLANGTGTGKTFVALGAIAESEPKKALIVVPNRNIATQWKSIARKFFDLEIDDGKNIPQEGVWITTYSTMRERAGQLQNAGYDLVVFDESHKLKTYGGSNGSAQAEAAVNIVRSNPKANVLYASATPFQSLPEMKYLEPLGLWGDDPYAFTQFLMDHGYNYVDTQFGGYWKFDGTIEDILDVYKELNEKGIASQRELAMDVNLKNTFTRVPLDDRTRAVYSDINDKFDTAASMVPKYSPYRGLIEAQRTIANRRVMEIQKVDEAIRVAQKLLDEGRQVAIFTGFRGDLNAPQFKSYKMRGVNQVLATVYDLLDAEEGRSIDKIVEALGGPKKVAQVHGGVSTQIRDADIHFYNTGRKKVMVATAAAGGTGLSLHDTVGNAPRAQINTYLPWSGQDFQQVAGRSYRYGSKTDVAQYWLFADTAKERSIASVVGGRLSEMGALVAGIDVDTNAEKIAAFDFGMLDDPAANTLFQKGYQDWFDTDTGQKRVVGSTGKDTLYQDSDGELNIISNNGHEPEPISSALGSIEGADPTPPVQEMQEQGLREMLYPLLASLESKLTNPKAKVGTSIKGAHLPEETANNLRAYLQQVYGNMADTKLGAIRWGENRRDAALLNYGRRYGIDNVFTAIFPYQFWYTRTALQWALRAMDKPSWLANYARLQAMQDKVVAQPGFPSRLKGKMRVPVPFLPEWAQGSVYVEPYHQLFPFAQLFRWYDQAQEEKDQVARRAAYILQDQVASEELSMEEAQQAYQTRSGQVWEKALAQAKQEVDTEINNPADFISVMLGYSLPLEITRKYARGEQDQINQLPITRTIQSLTSWATPGGVNIEAPLRRALGLPERGPLGDFYVDRELANMVATGEIPNVEDALRAMVERSGPVYQMALKRAGDYNALRYAGAALWADFFPEGEEEQRKLQLQFQNAIDSKDPQAIAKFFEENPEYRARLLMNKWNDPEGRMRNFLVSEIWQAYRALPELHKKQLRQQLGEPFQQAFLDKETRSYDAIDTPTLAMWAKAMKGYVPTNAPQTPSYIPGVELAGQEATQSYQDFTATRENQFPRIFDIQSAYFNLPEEQRAEFLKQYPQLKDYWLWRDTYLAEHPEIIPYATGEESKLNNVPPEIAQQVYLYRSQRAQLFPNIFELQDEYFSVTSKAARANYRAKHPELTQYWDWQKEFLATYPQIIPYVKSVESIAEAVLGKNYSSGSYSSSTYGGSVGGGGGISAVSYKDDTIYIRARKDIPGRKKLKEYGFTFVGGMWVGPNNSRTRSIARKYGGYMPPEIKQPPEAINLADFPPALIRILGGHFKNGEKLGQGARKSLRNIWDKYGQPGSSFEDWLESTLKPTFITQ